MAKKRTKKQKIKARLRWAKIQEQAKKEKFVYSPEKQEKKPNLSENSNSEEKLKKKIIIKDLIKTGIISIILLGLLLLAYFQLR